MGRDRLFVQGGWPARRPWGHDGPEASSQCQTYLQLLGDIEFCRLIEQYNEEKMSYLIQKDDEKWKNEIFPKLVNFCEVFHDMLSK